MAPETKTGKPLLGHLESTNRDANPELNPLALKLATGAAKTTVSATSRPSDKNPKSGRIAVKVIEHLGDEVMKVFKTA